jgi:hypothetical protein
MVYVPSEYVLWGCPEEGCVVIVAWVVFRFARIELSIPEDLLSVN